MYIPPSLKKYINFNYLFLNIKKNISYLPSMHLPIHQNHKLKLDRLYIERVEAIVGKYEINFLNILVDHNL